MKAEAIDPMMKSPLLARVILVALLSILGAAARAAGTLDATPRTAVMSAFEPEWTALQAALHDRKEYVVNGTVFVTGTIEGKPVLLFLSGISMVNAAMTTQLALDRFAIDRIVFSGIAGGVDPALTIGDVVVPEAWSQYLESVFAREKNGSYVLPSYARKQLANYGMIFPQPVVVARGRAAPEERLWFPVDARLLAVARTVAGATALKACTAAKKCLTRKPRIVVGGRGVSGQAFVDNEAFRTYVRKTFDAEVLDMESAAVAHVAYANKTPFIAFRSLSDLAGGGEGENEMGTFFQLAADNSAAVVEAFLRALP
jgi:adenosylhomocysteine nucleosidase